MAQKHKANKAKKKAALPRKLKKQVMKAKSARKPPAKIATRSKFIRSRPRGTPIPGELIGYQEKGLGAFAGGQSGDLQGIPGTVDAGAEGVQELLEEGQTFEAEAVAGVQNAADPDVSEVVTHQYPVDDVPEEYREKE
jgi:hypothetical protein